MLEIVKPLPGLQHKVNVPYKRELVQRASGELSLIARAADLPGVSLDPDVKSSLIKDKVKVKTSSQGQDKQSYQRQGQGEDKVKVKRQPPYPSNSKNIDVGKPFKWCQFNVYKNVHVTQQPVSTRSEHELPKLH